ncbi:MAG: ferrous iron transport protein A [Nitrospiraceae bacterium]|nr:MAG: ferrous iron transport protein A [Nitrospiraceae bacterium]
MSPLGLLSAGEKAEVMEIRIPKVSLNKSVKDQTCHAEDMGLRAGKVVEMLNNGGGGPILLKINESRIAISRGIAMRVMVKRITS